MKAKYEAEKKEAQIAFQKAQLEEQRLRFGVVIIGLVLALLIGALLFRLTRQLRKRNEEKEFLIKEIHHRVKNNLQILSSLLHLQSRQIKDDTALHAVREGQNRVDTMGLIHQKLYMGDNVAKVEMKDYLEQFGQNILDSFGIEDGRVQIEYALEPMYLDVDTAIPLGLIINELTTNSLKYAFPGDRSGVIKIALWKNEKNHLVLSVSDNGAGLTAITDPKNSSSFGTSLVQMLSKKLKGKPETTQSAAGYATTIVFEKYD
jgi:two-component sensor histidine kinase